MASVVAGVGDGLAYPVASPECRALHRAVNSDVVTT
jgi:hypothetical protein